MPPRRRTTIYDFSSLRVHTDGSRVEQTNRNLRPVSHKNTARDSRGYWTARDAAGRWQVKRRRRNSSPSEPEEGKGKQKALESGEEEHIPLKKRKTKRAEKRRKFADDFSFLDVDVPAPSSQTISDTVRGNDPVFSSFSVPSSDLLKCIHHFASLYYSERGQLLNASKSYRLERKARQMKRLEKAKREESNDDRNPLDEDCHAQDAEQPAEDETDEEEPDDKEARSRRRGQKPKSLIGVSRRDMYKLMDGTALMAIGILLQEHVAHLLEPDVPDGWNDETDGDEGETGPVVGGENMAREDSEGADENEVADEITRISPASHATEINSDVA
ncbi:uncharacterized protein EV420DRAFT_1015296 [Desarmillaria tabescens]|uniref:Uncharacterized protein n=1 Tax=Armillaria tabescens TaxID=1929756 RepID=A0AA39MRU7_ARMTA|nr:uncharacterized protein EV420DRAFT_1015296 [Desarmillaria tabescens]KAK0443928.1 hypothetical protein EV420DRAFT_1015296 [Desarmillaria tabescens]